MEKEKQEEEEEEEERASEQHNGRSRILGSWRYQGLRRGGVEEASGIRRKQMPLRIRLPSCVMYTKGKKLFVALQGSGGGSAAELCLVGRGRQCLRRC